MASETTATSNGSRPGSITQDTAVCGTCNKQVGENENALECDVCDVWFHVKCQKVSIKLYEALREDDDDNIAWYCNNCKYGAKKLRLQVIAIQKDHETIKTALDNLTAQSSTNSTEIIKLGNTVKDTNQQMRDLQSSLDTRLEGIEAELSNHSKQDRSYLEVLKTDLEQKINSVHSKTTTTMQALEHQVTKVASTAPSNMPGSMPALGLDNTRALRQGLMELQQIEERKLNLIIINLPEQETPEEDIQAVTTMIKEEFKLNTKISKATRLGRQSEGRDRMLKIELVALGDKKLLLAKSKELRESNHEIYKKVYIRPDLTRNQMTESKNLRATLKEIRQAQPETNWVIRAGRIVEVKEQPTERLQ